MIFIRLEQPFYSSNHLEPFQRPWASTTTFEDKERPLQIRFGTHWGCKRSVWFLRIFPSKLFASQYESKSFLKIRERFNVITNAMHKIDKIMWSSMIEFNLYMCAPLSRFIFSRFPVKAYIILYQNQTDHFKRIQMVNSVLPSFIGTFVQSV